MQFFLVFEIAAPTYYILFIVMGILKTGSETSTAHTQRNLKFQGHLLVLYHYNDKNMVMFSFLVFVIRSPDYRTLLIINIFKVRAENIKGPYTWGWNMKNHLLVLFHFHCKNMVKWSSQVFEIWATTYRTLFIVMGFLTSGRKHRRPLTRKMIFSGSLTSGYHCEKTLMWSSLGFVIWGPEKYALFIIIYF